MSSVKRLIFVLLMAMATVTIARAEDMSWCEACENAMISNCGGYGNIASGHCSGDGTPGSSECSWECLR